MDQLQPKLYDTPQVSGSRPTVSKNRCLRKDVFLTSPFRLTLTGASSVLVGRTATHRWKTVFVQFDRQHPVDAVGFLRWNTIPDYDTYHNEGRLTPVQ